MKGSGGGRSSIGLNKDTKGLRKPTEPSLMKPCAECAFAPGNSGKLGLGANVGWGSGGGIADVSLCFAFPMAVLAAHDETMHAYVSTIFVTEVEFAHAFVRILTRCCYG